MVDNYKFENNNILIKLVDDLEFDYPVRQIYEDMGLDKGNLSSYLNKKKPVSIPYIKKIATHYNKDINNYKIVTIKDNAVTNNIEVTHLDANTSSIMQVPLVNQYAHAGYLNGFRPTTKTLLFIW